MGSTTKRPNPPGSRTSSVSSIPAAIRNKKKKTVIEGDDGSESGDSQEVSNPETPASTQNSKEASRSDEQELSKPFSFFLFFLLVIGVGLVRRLKRAYAPGCVGRTTSAIIGGIAPPTRSGVLGPSLRTNGSRLDELRSSMTNRLEEERTKFEAEKSDLISQHAEQIKSMESRHEDQINDLKAEHEEILVASLTKLDLRRTRKFESNLSALQEKHLAEINEIKLDHQKQIEAITANPETSGGPKERHSGWGFDDHISLRSVIRIVTLVTRAADADTSLTEWEAAPADPSTQHPTAASSHILFLLRNRP
ncbi:hypothetical protein PGT21_026732 [Puccinia graminis f. sp. tritici]|uniref:Uncharacterized protein n=1 Tax=Puccinia graminis f. sp. tritici TaxID=56615 RepID=A0A5B0N570_PUCGR|nr:hypothetical protein PGT21_026732 [Puccinia graminis f. sp. tritici]